MPHVNSSRAANRASPLCRRVDPALSGSRSASAPGPASRPLPLSHPTVFTAILLATLYYGPRPAIMVAILGYPAVEYWIRPEPFMGSPATVATTVVLYAALCALVIGLTHRFRLEHQALMAAARERERMRSGCTGRRTSMRSPALPTARSFSTA